MLEKELWISKLSEITEIDFSVSESLWLTSIDYFERLLSQNKKVLFCDKLCFYSNSLPEIFAVIPNSTSYLLPPRVEVEVCLSSSISDDKPIVLFDAKILSELSGVQYSVVDNWCNSVCHLFEKEINEGEPISLKNLALIKPILEDNEVVGLNIILDDGLRERINKPFSMFEPVEMTSLQGHKDIERVEVESLTSFFDKYKEKTILYSNKLDDKVVTESSLISESSEYITEPPLDDNDNSSNDNLVPNNVEYSNGLISRDENIEDDERKGCSRWMFILPIILVLALFFIFSRQIWSWATSTFNVNSISNIFNSSEDKSNDDNFIIILDTPDSISVDTLADTTISDSVDFREVTPSDTTSTNVDTISLADTTKDEKANSPNNKTDDNYVTSNISDKEETVIIKKGDRLTLYALNKYGKKVFWVYIYEENRDKIKNPDNIAIGTKIILPAASKYNIDANSNKSVSTALVLEKSIKENK